jgi:S-adenosylmethionine hydrolase
VGKGRSFYISMRRARSDIRTVGKSYLDGTPGEPVAVFNSMGLLEIAICMGGNNSGYGGASALLGLKYQDPVRIEFQSSTL